MLLVLTLGVAQLKSRWLVPALFLAIGPVLLRTRILLGPNTRRVFWLVIPVIMIAASVAVVLEAADGTQPKETSKICLYYKGTYGRKSLNIRKNLW